MSDAEDRPWMARALRIAARGRYGARPNPRVGCVLVRGGAIVGEGAHLRAGMPHAEVHALADAGDAAGGATAYITLEPCSHHGRTPPCAPALVDAGVARVVVAMRDPNPQVAGRGLALLREAGIEVECGLLEAEARALNPGFVRRMERGRPWVRCKLAMSLDGRTALASGESRWITGDAARRDVHRMRAASCAVLTGIGTVLADDPQLDVRIDHRALSGYDPARGPLRVVLDPALEMPPTARMLAGPCLILTASTDAQAADALRRAGAEVETVPAVADGLELGAVLDLLGGREINELMVEAGATLSGALLDAGLIDELVIYMAPLLLGDGARGLFHLPALQSMAERIELELLDVRRIDCDVRLTARPRRIGSACTSPGEAGKL